MLKELFSKIEKDYNLITVLGPTAGGKTSFGANLAYKLNSEIISADSRQVYKKMDIGTGKDIEDYTIEDIEIPFHLVDILDAGEKYNLFNYQKDFFNVFREIRERNIIPIMCGGTGLYLDAIVRNYELQEVPENAELRKNLESKSLEELTIVLSEYKELHNVSDIDTKKRAIRAIEIEIYKKENPININEFPKINSINFGIKLDRASQKKRITQRLEQRLKEGMIEEVEGLIKDGVDTETLIYYGLEYKFITLFLLNKMSFEEMKEKLNIAIHQFSKRQMTWFRRMEKNGVKIWWLDGHATMKDKLLRVEEILKSLQQHK